MRAIRKQRFDSRLLTITSPQQVNSKSRRQVELEHISDKCKAGGQMQKSVQGYENDSVRETQHQGRLHAEAYWMQTQKGKRSQSYPVFGQKGLPHQQKRFFWPDCMHTLSMLSSWQAAQSPNKIKANTGHPEGFSDTRLLVQPCRNQGMRNSTCSHAEKSTQRECYTVTLLPRQVRVIAPRQRRQLCFGPEVLVIAQLALPPIGLVRDLLLLRLGARRPIKILAGTSSKVNHA